MSTAPKDRLNQLFAGKLPSERASSTEPHFSEKELEEKKLRDQQPKKWEIPAAAEYPRKIKKPAAPQPSNDLLTSSDDDDYVNAFAHKPSIKTQSANSKCRVMPEPNAFGYPKDAPIESKASIEYIPTGKKSSKNASKASSEGPKPLDTSCSPLEYGSQPPVTVQFCQFTLAAKFPYKYMNDSNDRVSRHFFASNKFYSRMWNL